MSTCQQAIAARRRSRKDPRYAKHKRKDPVRTAERQRVKELAAQKRRNRNKKSKSKSKTK